MTATRSTPLARAVFAALVVAGFLAFFWAQQLKHRDPLVARWTHADLRFPRPGSRYAHFHVRVTVSGPLSVRIVSDRTGRTVATVTQSVRRYRTAGVTWDGRTQGGTLAPAGAYRVAVLVAGADAPVPLTGLTLTVRGGGR
jgi:hypothetical protein